MKDPAPRIWSWKNEPTIALALWAAMVTSFVVRVAFLADKPLWRDEAWVALISADPLGAAMDGRAAPLGFLLLTKLVTSWVPGPPEVTYRLVPLAAGLALIPLLARWMLALGGSRREAVAVGWLSAGLQPLIYYSRELKSYDLDALVAVVVPLLAMRGFAQPDPSARARLAFLGVLLLTPWMTFGGIFAVAALLTWGTLVWAPGAVPEVRRAWAGCCAAFLLSFAAAYLLVLESQSSDPWMLNYWRYYLDGDQAWSIPIRFAKGVWAYGRVSWSYFFGSWWPAFVAVAAVGAWKWPPPHRRFLLLLYAVTATLCVTAAMLDRYLLVSGRLLLFAAPVALLWVARGLTVLAAGLPARLGPALALGLPLALSLSWSVESVEHRLGRYRTNPAHFFRFDTLHDVDQAIAETVEIVGKDDPVLVSRRCSYAFQFYNRGRIASASYCERHCTSFRGLARGWLRRNLRSGRGDRVRRHGGREVRSRPYGTGLTNPGSEQAERAWILLSDEDKSWLLDLLVEEGFTQRPHRVSAAVYLWEIRPREKSNRSPRLQAQPSAGTKGSSRVRPGAAARETGGSATR